MKNHQKILTLGLTLCLSIATTDAGEIAIKDGQKLAFLGDSITQFGWSYPAGYVQLVVTGLKANGVTVVPIPAGISGHKSNDMLGRLDRSVLSKKPDWMTVSCGVNDVWHGARGVPLDQYRTNITAIIDQAQTSGVQVVILTSTPIQENLTNVFNQTLSSYNDFLRTVAKTKNCRLADLDADCQAAIKASAKPGRVLTVDGVHMNPHGNEVMATGVLKAFGLSDAQLAKARQAWAEIPGGWSVSVTYQGSSKTNSLSVVVPLTRAQYEKFQPIAAAQPKGGSVNEYLRTLFEGDVRALLKPAGEYATVDAIFEAKQNQAVLEQLQHTLTKQVADLVK